MFPDYAKERKQFSKPIAGYQLTQAKFAEMVTNITQAQLLVYRLGRLKDEGKMNFQQVSMAKRNNCTMAREIAKMARRNSWWKWSNNRLFSNKTYG